MQIPKIENVKQSLIKVYVKLFLREAAKKVILLMAIMPEGGGVRP